MGLRVRARHALRVRDGLLAPWQLEGRTYALPARGTSVSEVQAFLAGQAESSERSSSLQSASSKLDARGAARSGQPWEWPAAA